jgi:uncharacterized protein YdhG (YjbR/CyaY superfamily)
VGIIFCIKHALEKPMSIEKKTKKSDGFSDFEKQAMKERAKELKAEQKAKNNREAGLKALLEKIAEMDEPDRSMATRFHEIVTAAAPELMPKTWYSMPAYARNDKVVCFFQSAAKFKTRYSTFGFSDEANLDEGGMWATGFALKELNTAEEKKIIALVKKAIR